MLTFVFTLACTWLGPPPPDGAPSWQWPQRAPRPPAIASPLPAAPGPGPGRSFGGDSPGLARPYQDPRR